MNEKDKENCYWEEWSANTNGLPLLSVNSKITHGEGDTAEQYTIHLPLRQPSDVCIVITVA